MNRGIIIIGIAIAIISVIAIIWLSTLPIYITEKIDGKDKIFTVEWHSDKMINCYYEVLYNMNQKKEFKLQSNWSTKTNYKSGSTTFSDFKDVPLKIECILETKEHAIHISYANEIPPIKLIRALLETL